MLRLPFYRYSIVISAIVLGVFSLPNLSMAAGIRASSPSEASASGSASTGVLVYELQALQQEVLALRGLLEEQSHEIKRLKQQRLDDYLDLDKRITKLTRQQSSEGNSAGSSTVLKPSGNPIGSHLTPALPTDQGKELYSEAIDRLLNQQDYSGAEERFSQYLAKYPQGQYTPNVYYWQGQIFLSSGKKALAEDAFKKLASQYPENPKAADAKFKLARLYYEQGKKQQAKVILDEVAVSDTDAALLAKAFISKHY